MCPSICTLAGFLVPAGMRISVINGGYLKPTSSCMNGQPAECSTAISFDYFFHNITNYDAFLSGKAPVIDEVGPFSFDAKEVRFNIDFSPSTASYNNLYLQTYNEAASCPDCDPAARDLVTANRGYLALFGAFDYSDYALLLTGVPTAFEALYKGMEGVLMAVGVPPASVAGAALTQFAQCSELAAINPALFSFVDGVNAADPAKSLWPPGAPVPEVCGWAARVAGVPTTAATISLPVASFVAGQLLGTYHGPGAMPAVNFAIWVATTPADTLAGILHMPAEELKLVQGYVFYLAVAAVEPSFRAKYFNADLDGGSFTRNSAQELVFGHVDKIMGDFLGPTDPRAFVAHGIGFGPSLADTVAALAPSGSLADVDFATSPLVGHFEYYRGIDSDKNTGKIAAMSHKSWWPYTGGEVRIDGLWDALFFGTRVEAGMRFNVWVRELDRVVTYVAVREEEVDELSTMRLELSDDSLAPCAGDPGSPPCVAGDHVRGAWDQTATYGTPTVQTLPMYEGCDIAQEDLTWASPSTMGPWYLNVDIATGNAIRGSKTYIMSNFVPRTEVFYPHLYVPDTVPGAPASLAGRPGLWVPSYGIRIAFEASQADLKKIHGLRSFLALIQDIAIALAVLGAAVGASGAAVHFAHPVLRRWRRDLEELQKSQAPSCAIYEKVPKTTSSGRRDGEGPSTVEHAPSGAERVRVAALRKEGSAHSCAGTAPL